MSNNFFILLACYSKIYFDKLLKVTEEKDHKYFFIRLYLMLPYINKILFTLKRVTNKYFKFSLSDIIVIHLLFIVNIGFYYLFYFLRV